MVLFSYIVMKMFRVILDVKRGFEKLLLVTSLFFTMFFLQVVHADESINDNNGKNNSVGAKQRVDTYDIESKIKKLQEELNDLLLKSEVDLKELDSRISEKKGEIQTYSNSKDSIDKEKEVIAKKELDQLERIASLQQQIDNNI